MKIASNDIETLVFRADDGSSNAAVKLVYLPNGREYVCDECTSQILNRRRAAEALLRDLLSGHPKVPMPKMVLFDQVRILEPNTPRDGAIRDLVWHYKDAVWNYYVESEGKKISKRYLDSDLERLGG